MFTDFEMKMMAFIATQTAKIEELETKIKNMEVHIWEVEVNFEEKLDGKADSEDLVNLEKNVDNLEDEVNSKMAKEDLEGELCECVQNSDLEQQIEDKVKEILAEVKISIEI